MIAAPDRLLLLVRREFRRPSHFHAARLGAVAALSRPAADDIAMARLNARFRHRHF